MQVQLSYEGAKTHPSADARLHRFRISTWPDGKWLRTILLSVSSQLEVSWKYDGRGDRSARFQRAVMLLVLDEIERLGPALLESEKALELQFGSQSHYDVVQAADESTKSCEYQKRRGRDLFCRAVEGAPTPDREAERRDLTGRTSRIACETICTLPDTRLLCSAFIHVGMIMRTGSPPHPRLGPRVCDAGNDERIAAETRCVPGGHSCWHRIIEIETAATRPVEPPLALLEALDFLSVVWADTFKTARLVRSLGTAPAGEIVLPCSTREEFKSRLSALSDIFKMCAIDDALVPNLAAIPKDQTWNRVKEVAKGKLIKSEADRVEVAIGRLRWVNEIRTGLQHGAVGQKAQQAANAIGMAWPPTDWSAAWNYVRGVTVEALREIRQAIDVP